MLQDAVTKKVSIRKQSLSISKFNGFISYIYAVILRSSQGSIVFCIHGRYS